MTAASTLIIEVKGEVVSSTFPAFAEMVRSRLSEINRDLSTDEDFEQADNDAKAIKGAEEELTLAKAKALEQAEEMNALFGQIDGLNGELSKARLDLTKQIDKRKLEVKAEIIAAAMDKLICADRHRKPVYGTSVADAVKGKKSIDSMKKALDTIVTIHNGTIKKCRTMIESFTKTHGQDLVMDAEDLEVKSPDSVEAELRRRFEMKKAADQLEASRKLAAEAQAEADKAKLALEESTKPPAAPVETSAPAAVEDSPFAPSSGMPAMAPLQSTAAVVEITEAEEWKSFESSIEAALRALNLSAKRQALIHQKNKSRAQVLANAFGAAWGNR